MKKFNIFLLLYIVGMLALTVNVGGRFPLVFAEDSTIEKLEEEKQERVEAKEELVEKASTVQQEQAQLQAELEKYKESLINTQGNIEAKTQLITEIAKNKVLKNMLYEDKVVEKQGLMRSMYMQANFTPMEMFLGSNQFSDFTLSTHYYTKFIFEIKRQSGELQVILKELANVLTEEEKKRAQLEAEARYLATTTVVVDKKVQEAAADLDNINSQIGTLESEIANISAKQEELVRAKLAATQHNTTVGASEYSKDDLPDPGFSPAYAVFSYGYPHRVGMSQYGALGRSKAGQSYEEILNAYYANIDIVDWEVPDEIKVTGNTNDTIPFEDQYMKGIAEMPASWANEGGIEALKAQAVAARTYALAYTGNGKGSICDTQSCQVYLESKAESDSAKAWHDAVEATRGQVMVYDDQPIKAWYASTAGGYTRLPTDFDVKWNNSPPYIKRVKDLDGSGNAYEGPEYGDSPWYHKSWYSSSDGHPWLTEEEMADLFNAAQLPESYNDELSHPDNDGLSYEDVAAKVEEEGGSVVAGIKDIGITYSGEGYTTSLKVTHQNGTTEIDGPRFRKVFVLRSRGNLALWSSMFDIVTK